MAEHKTIKGPRHSNGGVPLNLPDDTFIYSDFKGMSVKEPELLTMFGKNSKGESQIDFDKPISVTSNLISRWNGKVTPSLETLMETFLETGDRKNHVYAKVLIKP